MTNKPGYEFKNLTKAQQDCLSLIESLGIYELRALARVFGDNSPTILKRNDHIKIVMDKIISGEDLKPIPLRQGRPYKELSNIEGILAGLSQITGKDYVSVTNSPRNLHTGKKIVTFNQVEDEVVKQKLFPIEVRGVLFDRNETEFFLTNEDNGKTVLVKKDENSQLKPYDYITGTAIVMNSNKEYLVDSIKTVNFKPYKNYVDSSNPYEQSVPTETLKLGNKEFVLGSRYIVENCKFSDGDEKLKQLLKTLNENKIATIAFIPNVLFENFASIKKIGFNNVFISRYDDRPFTINETLNTFIENVKRLQEQGLKLALFVEDITTIANAVDYANKNNTKALMGHTETTVELIKQLMMLAKSGGKDKNTTIFTTADQADLFDQLFVSSVYKISKKIAL